MSCFLNAKQVAKLVNDFFGISCGDSATPSFTKPKQPLLHHGDEFFAPKRLPTHSPLILPRPTVNFQREYLAYYIHAGTVPSCLLQNRVPFCSFGIWVRAGLGCFLPEFLGILWIHFAIVGTNLLCCEIFAGFQVERDAEMALVLPDCIKDS